MIEGWNTIERMVKTKKWKTPFIPFDIRENEKIGNLASGFQNLIIALYRNKEAKKFARNLRYTNRSRRKKGSVSTGSTCSALFRVRRWRCRILYIRLDFERGSEGRSSEMLTGGWGAGNFGARLFLRSWFNRADDDQANWLVRLSPFF